MVLQIKQQCLQQHCNLPMAGKPLKLFACKIQDLKMHFLQQH